MEDHLLCALPRGRFLLDAYSNIYKILSWLPYLPVWSFLIRFQFKYDVISSPGCIVCPCNYFFPDSYSIWCKILSWLPCPSVWSLLIEFPFRCSEVFSTGCLRPAIVLVCLLNSYSNMMQYCRTNNTVIGIQCAAKGTIDFGSYFWEMMSTVLAWSQGCCWKDNYIIFKWASSGWENRSGMGVAFV